MTLIYIPGRIQIDIFIPTDEIDSTDIVKLYEVNDPSAGTGFLVTASRRATVIEIDLDPSIGGTEEYYKFRVYREINIPNTYSFYYTINDTWGNESDPVTYFDVDACLTPVRPDPVEFDDLDFTGSQAEQSLSSDLIVQLKMNDNEDNTSVLDNIENISATYNIENTEDRTVDGKIDRALSFTGTPDYIDTNDTFQSTFRDSFSINLWMKPVDAEPGSAQYLFGVANGGNNRCRLFFTGTDLSFDYYAGVGFPEIFSASSGFIDDTWHMVTVTVEAPTSSSSIIKMYVDNVEIEDSGQKTIALDVYSSIYNLFIGALNDEGVDEQYFEGCLDNLTIWQKVLTTDDISELWNDGDGTEQNPVDLVDEYYTLSHTSLNDGNVVIDGNYPTDTITYFVDKPLPDLFDYKLTATDVDCETTSEDSIPLSIDFRPPALIPTSDPVDLYIAKNALGSFLLTWTYRAPTDRIDPITHFNIYVDNTIIDPSTGESFTDPSGSELPIGIGDPSSGGWVLDGTVNHSVLTAKFSYTTQSQVDGNAVCYKIVPAVAGDDGTERLLDDPIIVCEIADATPPSVTTDFIQTTVT